MWTTLRGIERGLLVAGKLDTPVQGAAVLRLAERLGWPLLPDVGSQVRLGQGAASNHLIGFYDLILGSPAFKEKHTPEAVLHLGGRPTSKRLLHYLARHRPQPYFIVNGNPHRLDPHHHVSRRIEADVEGFCDALAHAADSNSNTPSPWLTSWRDASSKAEAVIKSFSDEADVLSEPLVARLITQAIPGGHGLVLASSMPVRDVDMFAALDGPAAPIAANRGASGIDGTIATAGGFSEGLNAPATLLIGDLALLHDLNSLALFRERPVTVVVLNNDGGGIFHFLPIAAHDDVFEPCFGTPHGLSFEAAATFFGLAYHHPQTPQDLLDAYRAACSRRSGTIIEVTTERRANHALHQELLARIGAQSERTS